MQKLRTLISTLGAIATLAMVMVTVPQTSLKAQKGKGEDGAPSASIAAGILSEKNLKVLAPEKVDYTMQQITFALGVGCIYCHEVGNRPADSKPQKLKARMMLEMVRDINASFGDGQTHVTCWTCHRSKTQPQFAKAEAP